MADFVKDYESACAALEAARAAYAADTADPYLRLQYKSAAVHVHRLRAFWRGVDSSVDMANGDYGKPTGDGRRGGEFIKIQEAG